jgi:hypothetical protein
MEIIKRILIVLVLLALSAEVYLIITGRNGNEEAPIGNPSSSQAPLDKSKLCSNEYYKTMYYDSADKSMGKTIQLDTESMMTLKNVINYSNGNMPEGELAGLECLEELDIENTDLKDLGEFSRLTDLKVLNLQSSGITDLSPLSKLNNLEVLNLNHNPGITDLSPLSGLVSLRKLFLGYADISDLKPLSGLVNMEELAISWTKVTDVSPLKSMTKLKLLYTRDVKILAENLRSLKDNTSLVIIKH